MLALIDADSLVYSAGFTIEHREYHIYLRGYEEEGLVEIAFNKKELNQFLEKEDNPDMFIIEEVDEIEPLSHCLQIVKSGIENTLDAVGTNKYKVFITGNDYYRRELATILPYKGNRDSSHRPVYYDQIRQYLIDEWNANLIDEVEADDAVAIAHDKDKTVVCSIDKDLDQLEGWHYNPRRDEKYYVDADAAIKNFYMQMLTGDASDNILGIKGIGPKKAEKILDGLSPEEMKCAVGLQYAVAYDDPESAMLENGRLLWLRRHKDDIWSI